ncbi:MAG: ABC transporter ATP-binding protein [Deltaproteobacteria bacterium]|nr:ABC transporter ATP-binding protein [Deltaproteobacteria bacterium]
MSCFEASFRKTFHGKKGEEFSLDLDFTLPEGKITVIFGPSGSGKSTILRLIAGLDAANGGVFKSAGETWFNAEKGINLAPQERQTGFLFQDLALFPHLTVEGNMSYAIEKKSEKLRIKALLEMTELTGLEHRYPHELSGGQQQRLALARSIAGEPKLLLLDEPFSALDRSVKKRIHEEFLKFHDRFGFTALMVTHDISEAYRLAEHAIILKEGKKVKEGTPEEVFLGKTLSTRIQIPVKVIEMESDEIHTLLTVEEGRRTFRVFVDNDEAKKITIGDEVIVAAKASEALVFKV